MFLSGGVDSSTIASLVVRHHKQSRYATCATTGSQGEACSESRAELSSAAICAEKVGFDLDPVAVTSCQYKERWTQLVGNFRSPLSTPSDVMIHEIAKAAKQHVGVVLGGEGSDELFCGYAVPHWSGYDYDVTKGMRHGCEGRPSMLRSIVKQYGRSSFRDETDHYFALNSLIPSASKSRILREPIWSMLAHDGVMHGSYQSLYDFYDGVPTVEKHALVLHRVNLESLLARLDATTMHAGLEARVPFTDHVLVEKMFQIPFAYRIDARHSRNSRSLASAELAAKGQLRPKRILRDVANRLLPASLANRRKASFPTGVQHWLQSDWKVWLTDYLANSPFTRFMLCPQFLDELTGKPAMAGMWLWPIANLALWGDGEFF
jgi:asparagine synthase (glutamine-hydrolysing)